MQEEPARGIHPEAPSLAHPWRNQFDATMAAATMAVLLAEFPTSHQHIRQ
jgi:hypothetical protein